MTVTTLKETEQASKRKLHGTDCIPDIGIGFLRSSYGILKYNVSKSAATGVDQRVLYHRLIL